MRPPIAIVLQSILIPNILVHLRISLLFLFTTGASLPDDAIPCSLCHAVDKTRKFLYHTRAEEYRFHIKNQILSTSPIFHEKLFLPCFLSVNFPIFTTMITASYSSSICEERTIESKASAAEYIDTFYITLIRLFLLKCFAYASVYQPFMVYGHLLESLNTSGLPAWLENWLSQYQTN